MDRVLLIPYEVKSRHGSNYEVGSINQRKFHRCFAVCFLFMFFLLVAYMPVQFHQGHSQSNSQPTAIISGWSHNTSRDLKAYVRPNNITSIIPLLGVCFSPLFLLVVICSAVANTEARLAIRETWGASSSNVRFVFLLGDPENVTMQEMIEEESLQYNDIIQEGFQDSYNNLTLKSVMMLKWVNTRCNNVRFIMKTDDDMFVNVDALLKFLKTRSSVGLLIGSLICGARPIADPQSKWFAPRYMFSGRVYPNYLSGTGYVMSRDVAKRLYKTALTVPLFHLEDVYLTGMCSRAAGIKPRDNGAFTYNHRKFEPCSYRSNGVITSHRITPVELRSVWLEMNNSKLDCTKILATTLSTKQNSKQSTQNKQKIAALKKQANKCF